MSEIDYHKILDSINDAIWVLDRDQRILYVNRASERFFGRKCEDMIGKYCWEIAHSMQGPVSVCPFTISLKSLKREAVEMLYNNRWLQVTVDPILDDKDSFAGTVHIVTDITERKMVEKSLAESELRNRIIAEMISDYAYIFRVTPEGILKGEWVTESFIKTFGYTIPEIDGLGGWQSLVYQDDLNIAIAHAQKVAGGQEDIIEMRWVTADGEVRWLRDYAKPVFDETGKHVVRIFGATQDITEQKKIEEKLHANYERFKNLVSSLHDIVWEATPDGSQIVDVNESFERVYGCSADNLKTNPKLWLELVHPDDRIIAELSAQKLFKEGISVSEYRIIRPDGKIRWILDRKMLVKDGLGNPLYMTGIATDITERKQVEEEHKKLQQQLLHIQKLDALGRLAGGIAHDFNNTLHVILCYAEIIMQKLPQWDQLREEVRQIIEVTQKAALLTQQLLAFSRKQVINPQVLNINDILRNLQKMLKRLVGEDIEMELNLADDLGMVVVDAVQFEQVLVNLVVNARDAMPKGGKLTISTVNVNVDEHYARFHPDVKAGRYVMVSVTDTGCGMDENVLSHIFEPFFTTKEHGRGTGLGLSTVYGIVKQSGGNIEVYSKPGEGTTFKIYLPITQSKLLVKEEVLNKKNGVIGSGKQVLLVEDEEALRQVLKTILTMFGFQVLIANNGEDAQKLVERLGFKPDLVITDVVMPKVSGPMLVERLRKQYPQLKALYMSGYNDDIIGKHGVLEQVKPFIQKPFKLKDLSEKISQILNER